MKANRSLAVLLMLFVCVATIFAQDSKKKEKPVDPSGTWRWEYEMQGNTIKDHAVLQLGKEGKVTGLMYSTSRDEPLKVKRGSFKNGKLTFSTVLDFQGTEVDLEFSGKVKGDELVDGQVNIESEQGEMELPWEPKRSVEMSDVVGEWHFVFDVPDGSESNGTLIITNSKEDKKKFTGKYTADRLDDAKVKKLKIEKNKLSFRVEGTAQGVDILGDIAGRPYGNTMKGMLDIQVGDNEFEIPFTANRKVTEPKKKQKDAG